MNRRFYDRAKPSRDLRSAGLLLALFSGAIFLASPSIAHCDSDQDKNQTQTPAALTPEQIEHVHSRLHGAHLSLIDKDGNRLPEIARQLAKTSGDIYLRNYPATVDFLESDVPPASRTLPVAPTLSSSVQQAREFHI